VSVGRIELLVTRPGHPERRLMLQSGVLRLGRGEDNDLVLADVGVSRRHARIVVSDTGALIEDLGSGNGTLYEGQPVRQHHLKDGDQLQIEPFLLEFKLSALRAPVKPKETGSGGVLVVLAGEQLSPRYLIPPAGITIGRATDQSIVLHDPGSSRRHAVISVRQGGFWLEDNGSANGIFVNGTRVWQHLLQNEDVVRIGTVELRFELDVGSKADPFSQIWDESGVWERPPSEDGAAPFAMPPPRQLIRDADDETQTATRPLKSSSRKRSMQSLSIVAGVFAALLIGGALVVAWQASVMLNAQEEARPVPILLAPTPVLSVEDALAVERRKIQGQALLEADRPMEAVLYLYQALKLSPTDADLKHLGAAACEEAVLGELTEHLHAAQLSEADSRGTYRDALQAARRPTEADLPLVRTQLADALLVFPDDADLLAALKGIDAALAAVALERAGAAGSLSGDEARTQLEEALALSPTFDVAAEVLAAENLSAQRQARMMVEQAIRLELFGLPAEAAALYAAAAVVLPGTALPLEQLAAARMSALAR
jgi:pSer/pThr/pTyr-binding forkhead associated (FHA) protein